MSTALKRQNRRETKHNSNHSTVNSSSSEVSPTTSTGGRAHYVAVATTSGGWGEGSPQTHSHILTYAWCTVHRRHPHANSVSSCRAATRLLSYWRSAAVARASGRDDRCTKCTSGCSGAPAECETSSKPTKWAIQLAQSQTWRGLPGSCRVAKAASS